MTIAFAAMSIRKMLFLSASLEDDEEQTGRRKRRQERSFPSPFLPKGETGKRGDANRSCHPRMFLSGAESVLLAPKNIGSAVALRACRASELPVGCDVIFNGI